MRRALDTLLHGYLWVLMVGLLLQGIGSLAFRLMPTLTASAPYIVGGVLGIDAWHALIHIVWGSAGIVTLLRHSRHALIQLALVFGTFYTALGIAGVAIHHPLGLELDWIENAFHLTAGPASLLLGALAAGRPEGERALAARR